MNYSQQQQHPWKLTYSAVSGRNSWSPRKIQNGMSNKQHDWLINYCVHCSSSNSRWSLHKERRACTGMGVCQKKLSTAIGCYGLHLFYTEFGVDSSSRLPFRAWTHRHTKALKQLITISYFARKTCKLYTIFARKTWPRSIWQDLILSPFVKKISEL